MSLLNTLIPSLNRTPAANDDNRPADLVHAVKPTYEVKETPEAWGLTVYLPGVAKDGLELTAEEGQFRIVGRRNWKQPEGWTSLYRETSDAAFTGRISISSPRGKCVNAKVGLAGSSFGKAASSHCKVATEISVPLKAVPCVESSPTNCQPSCSNQ